MDIGTVQSINIDQEMRSSYLDYAMSVIVALIRHVRYGHPIQQFLQKISPHCG
jgi:DNA gyrase/topoisomerase IV subunit A